MNDENIESYRFDKLAASKQREIASKGGRARARQRLDKRDSIKRMKMLLELPCPDGEGGFLVSNITGKPMSVGEALDTALIKKGLAGNVKAICAIYDLLGLNVMKVEASTTVSTRSLEEIDEELERLRRIDQAATGSPTSPTPALPSREGERGEEDY